MAMMAMFRGCFFHSCTIARCGVCTHDAGVAVSAVRRSSLGVLARVAVGADRSSSLGVLTSHPHRIHTSHPHNLFPCFFCEIDSFRTISKVLVYFVLWELMEQSSWIVPWELIVPHKNRDYNPHNNRIDFTKKQGNKL